MKLFKLQMNIEHTTRWFTVNWNQNRISQELHKFDQTRNIKPKSNTNVIQIQWIETNIGSISRRMSYKYSELKPKSDQFQGISAVLGRRNRCCSREKSSYLFRGCAGGGIAGGWLRLAAGSRDREGICGSALLCGELAMSSSVCDLCLNSSPYDEQQN